MDSPLAAADPNDPLCANFPCEFGYSCVVGRKPYTTMGIFTDEMIDTLPFFELDNINSQYCNCEEYDVEAGHGGMTDVTCGTMFSRCPDNLICFHGAPCVEVGGDSYACDCSRSKNNFNLPLRGEHCGYIVNAEQDDDIIDSIENNEVDTDPLCHQDQGYADPEDATRLTCESGYKCRVGQKGYKSMAVFTEEMIDTIPLFEIDNLDGEYCDCEESSIGRGKSGMTGVACSTTFTRCGDDSVCLHGAPCKYVGKVKESEHMCDCAHISSPSMTFMGNYCELHDSTSTKETIEEETAKKETIEKETAKKETIEKETAKKETRTSVLMFIVIIVGSFICLVGGLKVIIEQHYKQNNNSEDADADVDADTDTNIDALVVDERVHKVQIT